MEHYLEYRYLSRGKMVHFNLIDDIDLDVVNIFRNFYVMPFVGKYDKNGNKIYANDIVETKEEWTTESKDQLIAGGYPYMYYGIGVVTYNEYGSEAGKAHLSNCEVIGNTYLNPELVEKIKEYENKI